MKKQLAFAILSLTALLAAYGGAIGATNPCPQSGSNPDSNFSGWFTVTKCVSGLCNYQGISYTANKQVAWCPLWCCPGDAASGTHTYYPSECNPGFAPPASGNPCCVDGPGWPGGVTPAPACPSVAVPD